MPNAKKLVIAGEDGFAAKVNSAGALEVDATLTPSGTQDVNLTQVGGAAVTAGAGAVAAGTPRVTLASNDPAVTALQLLDNAIGTVAAGAAGTASELTGAVYNSAAPTLTTGQQVATQVDPKGAAIVGPSSGTGTQASVAATGADQTILAANAARQGFTVYNDSSAILYLLLSNAVATTSAYTYQLAPGGYYEGPFGYRGIVKGIYASATGNARVTEFTA